MQYYIMDIYDLLYYYYDLLCQFWKYLEGFVCVKIFCQTNHIYLITDLSKRCQTERMLLEREGEIRVINKELMCRMCPERER